tara:strand:+ start:930 stop:1298 length:369 start_codon:yes stop_codon:yes gene_type:complete
MSYLEIPITALNGQTKVIIPKGDILYARQGDAVLPQPTGGTVGTTVTLFLSSQSGTFDTLTLTHTVLSAAVIAAGYNVADVINETLASNPGGIIAKVGGIPATLSATFQALSFVQFSAPVLA